MKFRMELGKSSTETLSLVEQVYGNKGLPRALVFEWLKRFQNDRESISGPDDPSTSRADDKIVKITNLIHFDNPLSTRAIAETVGIDKSYVRQILCNNFGMQKIC
ncbi:FLJ37770-like protein [Trichonephila clavipes]|nr:FLJ37770-like protein [Trichonephila clavipes]